MSSDGTTLSLDRNGRATAIELPRYRLTVTDGPAAGHSANFELPHLRIGSGADSEFRLEDPSVSREHCDLRVDEKGFLARDLESKNGTQVNGLWIREAYLEPGATLQLGASTVRLDPSGERVSIPLYDGESFGGVLGRSLPMRQLMQVLEKVAPKEATVLLIGETGTGKEVIARALHEQSPRDDRPFLTLDCGALGENLIESELFGHAAGAFTGAAGERSSIFEDARGGTVFLDEIGELPLEQQSKLLRVLESREVRRVGENQPRRVEFRLIAATHRALADEVEEGNFRSDLYFRLSVVEVRVPPLRQRPLDIALYAEQFLEEFAEQSEAEPLEITPAALHAMERYDWPGNVRELRNVVERAYALSDPGQTEIDSPGLLLGNIGSAAAERSGDIAMNVPFDVAHKAFERSYLLALLERAGHNIPRAAELMGVRRQSLYRMLKRHGISP